MTDALRKVCKYFKDVCFSVIVKCVFHSLALVVFLVCVCREG